MIMCQTHHTVYDNVLANNFGWQIYKIFDAESGVKGTVFQRIYRE